MDCTREADSEFLFRDSEGAGVLVESVRFEVVLFEVVVRGLGRFGVRNCSRGVSGGCRCL